ncbi:MAG: CBS domain-containing protein [Gammaproteobacteria bacterium]|nr:CBS domain-containing protein [Gammaproteobacteria bacterium]MDH5275368.1 CBS domain-containing protein [Gammaproteobacteria bacterium]
MTDDDSDDRPGGTWYGRLRRVLKGDAATREDLLGWLRQSHARTVLDDEELAMLEGVLAVSETQVRDVMVPRSQMVVLERDAPRDELLKAIVDSGHSRFPVIGHDREEVVGILLAKDVLRHFVARPDQPFDISRYVRPATFIPESKRLNALLKEFRGSRNHIAIVVDEYGGITGLLTIEDVLEEIVGEIDDEHDPAETVPIQMQGAGCYHVRALTRIEEFNEFFGASLDDQHYDTVGGLVMHELGRLPRKGESLQLGEFRFRVLQADRRRILSIEVTRGSSAPADGGVAVA